MCSDEFYLKRALPPLLNLFHYSRYSFLFSIQSWEESYIPLAMLFLVE